MAVVARCRTRSLVGRRAQVDCPRILQFAAWSRRVLLVRGYRTYAGYGTAPKNEYRTRLLSLLSRPFDLFEMYTASIE
jgi:hypothetical protein